MPTIVSPWDEEELAWARGMLAAFGLRSVAEGAGRTMFDCASALGVIERGERMAMVLQLYRRGFVRSEIAAKTGCTADVVNAVIEREDTCAWRKSNR